MASGADVRVKRIYEDATPEDGTRVLIDRLWPRGLSKEDAQLDLWLKEVAPSNELRRWYGHDPARHDEFVARYDDELRDEERAAALRRLVEMAEDGRVTLLTATREVERSHVPVVAQRLEGGAGR